MPLRHTTHGDQAFTKGLSKTVGSESHATRNAHSYSPIFESSLGKPAVHRRLTAFKTRALTTAPSLRPLVAVAARLSRTRPITSPDTLPVPRGSWVRCDVVET